MVNQQHNSTNGYRFVVVEYWKIVFLVYVGLSFYIRTRTDITLGRGQFFVTRTNEILSFHHHRRKYEWIYCESPCGSFWAKLYWGISHRILCVNILKRNTTNYSLEGQERLMETTLIHRESERRWTHERAEKAITIKFIRQFNYKVMLIKARLRERWDNSGKLLIIK
jgi:hypothetical protein